MLQLKVILVLILAVVLVRSSNTTFRLRLSRDQDSNIITLTCRNDQQLELQGATFFLNGSELNPGNYPSFSNQNDQSGVVTFKINRQLEGFYSCGTGQGRSSPRSLIGEHMQLCVTNLNFLVWLAKVLIIKHCMTHMHTTSDCHTIARVVSW